MEGKATGPKETEGKATGAKATEAQDNQETGGKSDMLMGDKEMDNVLLMEGNHHKSYSELVIEVVRRKARVFMSNVIVRKTDKALSKGDDVVVCFPKAYIEDITERVEKIVGPGKGGSILIHVGTNNAERESITAVVEKYR